MGWKVLPTKVLGLREEKKNIGRVWLFYLPGGFRSLGRAGWSQSDHRKVFSLQTEVFLLIPVTEGKSVCWKVSSILGQWLPAVFCVCQIIPVFTHTGWAPVTPLGTSFSQCPGSRASRAVWTLSHWEYCHLNSSICFGGGKMGVLDRRWAFNHPLQRLKTTRSFCRFAFRSKVWLPLGSG